MTKKILSIFAISLVLCALGTAQTTMTSTTLSAAITSITGTTVRVASATGITGFTNGQPTTWIYVDKELMPVYSVNGTTLVVQRTGATALHASSAKVWVGPYNAFLQGDPSGSCTAANQPYLPGVSVATGILWNCGNGQWTAFSTYTARPTVGALLVAAATIAPTNPWHHITGATTITTITVPPAFPASGGCVMLIPDLIGSTTSTGGNVALASTFVVNKALTLCIDNTAATPKWVPSY